MPPPPRETVFTHFVLYRSKRGTAAAAANIQSKPLVPGEETYVKLAIETIDELEWCLDQLETVQTHRSVSDMASLKFKRMLNKELSHLSESSKSGNQISEYICSTFLGKLVWQSMSFLTCHFNTDKQQDYDFPTRIDEETVLERSPQGQGPSRRSPRLINPPPMSQISGYNKRPLMHTNSFTSDRLPMLGVETPHENLLSQALSEMNNWGIDIFRIGTLSQTRPLTCVAYSIFLVSP